MARSRHEAVSSLELLFGPFIDDGLGCVACRKHDSGEFWSPFVIDEGLADAGEVANVFDGERRTDSGELGQGTTDPMFAVGASAHSMFDRLDRSPALRSAGAVTFLHGRSPCAVVNAVGFSCARDHPVEKSGSK